LHGMLMQISRFDSMPTGVQGVYEEDFRAAESISREVQGDMNKTNGVGRMDVSMLAVAVGLLGVLML